MLVVETPQDLKDHVGEDIGTSEWITVDQEMIDKFADATGDHQWRRLGRADATGDHQWIHVDVERAKRELPTGTTIAHGYLTLSLLPRLAQQIMQIKNKSRGINYGSNKVRFTGMVPAGSRVRLRQILKSVEDVKGNGVRIIAESTIEIEGVDRPALVAETIGLSYA